MKFVTVGLVVIASVSAFAQTYTVNCTTQLVRGAESYLQAQPENRAAQVIEMKTLAGSKDLAGGTEFQFPATDKEGQWPYSLALQMRLLDGQSNWKSDSPRLQVSVLLKDKDGKVVAASQQHSDLLYTPRMQKLAEKGDAIKFISQTVSAEAASLVSQSSDAKVKTILQEQGIEAAMVYASYENLINKHMAQRVDVICDVKK